MSAASRRLMHLRCYQIEDARRDLIRQIEIYGADHPAARAALGRWWFYAGRVPQKDATTVEAIAWARERSARGRLTDRPIWNRAQRRHATQKLSSAGHKDRYPANTGIDLPTHKNHDLVSDPPLAHVTQ